LVEGELVLPCTSILALYSIRMGALTTSAKRTLTYSVYKRQSVLKRSYQWYICRSHMHLR